MGRTCVCVSPVTGPWHMSLSIAATVLNRRTRDRQGCNEWHGICPATNIRAGSFTRGPVRVSGWQELMHPERWGWLGSAGGTQLVQREWGEPAHHKEFLTRLILARSINPPFSERTVGCDKFILLIWGVCCRKIFLDSLCLLEPQIFTL